MNKSEYNGYRKKWREAIRKRIVSELGGRCTVQGCKETKRLHIHHKKYWYPKGDRRNWDWKIKDLRKYKKFCVLLCSKHHKEIENDFVSKVREKFKEGDKRE